MNYEDMTKDELIAYIEELKSKRAFTYEDQMKLIILDNSPFTVWASDRNCIIKLWMGQCEALYGFSSKEVIGKDFVDLFVAIDEQVAARKDQIDIIDNNAIFHNIANDVGKNGNTLQLITNCRRVKDPVSGEYWNAEMGLIIDYLEQEKDRLKSIVDESQKIKSSVTQFVEDTKQVKEGFVHRKNSINGALRECEKKATTLRRREEFRKKTSEIRGNLANLSQKINDLYDVYVSKMQSSVSFNECEEIRQSFFSEFELISNFLEEMALDVFEISCDYDIEQNLVSDKDILMKDMTGQFRLLSELDYNILREVEKEIQDYKEKVSANPSPESIPFKLFLDARQEISRLKDSAEKCESELTQQIIGAKSRQELEIAKAKADVELKSLRSQMIEVQGKINGGT